MKTAILFIMLFGISHWFAPKKRVVFFGDSITQAAVEANGYIAVLQNTLGKQRKGGAYELIGAGISGNKVPDLQARLEKDVLARKPDLVFIYIGINDVWHFEHPCCKDNGGGTPKAVFETGLLDIIAQLKATGAKVVLCTPTVIGEARPGTNPQDKMLNEYAAISRRVATQTGSKLCDLRVSFQDYLRKNNKKNLDKNILTTDGVHLNHAGNQLVAKQMLAFL